MADTPQSPSPPAAERRGRPRQRTLKGAVVVFGNGSRTIDCQIRNLTETGAKLAFTSTAGVPDDFDVLVPPEKRRIAAHVLWRTNKDIGVVFIGDWRDTRFAV